jgi:Arc/MetJ-type ribon-helix-helix transcriptional regulator
MKYTHFGSFYILLCSIYEKMGEKGAVQGGERVAISYKMPPNVYEKVYKLVYEEKKFSTVSDCITQALIYFIDNHNDVGQFREYLEEYLASDEGKDFMKKMMKELLVDVLTTQQQRLTAEARK